MSDSRPTRLVEFLSHVAASVDRPLDQGRIRKIAKGTVVALHREAPQASWGVYLADTVNDKPSGGYVRIASKDADGARTLPEAYAEVDESCRQAVIGRPALPLGFVVTCGDNEALLRAAAAGLTSLLVSTPVTVHCAARNTWRSDGNGTEHTRVGGQELFAGSASGSILVIEPDVGESGSLRSRKYTSASVDGDELDAFESALADAEEEILRYIEDPTSIYRDVAEPVFRPQLLMLQDDAFSGAMRDRVKGGDSAAEAITTIATEFEEQFEAIEATRIREKADDVRDLKLRLLSHLPDRRAESFSARGRIAVLYRPLPSTLIRLALDGVAGLVLVGENLTAHVTILAGSLGIPALLIGHEEADELSDGESARLADGSLSLGAAPPTRASSAVSLGPERGEPTLTVDTFSRSIQLLANVNLLRDAHAAAETADGIGLYRSEFPFIIHQGFPSEEIQYRVYRDIANYFPSKPITFRTADIGGDKLIGAEHEGDANPFLGVRGIRFSLANRHMFRSQLRAMLRAGSGRNLKIMFPMVSTPDEIELARGEVQAAIYELAREGVPVNRSPKLGAMIEIPSAVMAVDELAEQLDFLSIGTNDLIMYMLAVDRTNSRVAGLYRTHHPIILRTLAFIAEHAGDSTEVSVCGAAAADPTMVPFFLGIGIRQLSVSPEKIAGVRAQISSLTQEDCDESAAEMLSIRSWTAMERYLAYAQEAAAARE